MFRLWLLGLITFTLVCLSTKIFPAPFDLDANNGTSLNIYPRAMQREVLFCVDLETKPVSDTGTIKSADHSFLWVSGNDGEGPLRIELVFTNDEPWRFVTVTKDFGKGNMANGPETDPMRKMYPIGTTRYANSIFLDPQTGKGLVQDAVNADAIYRCGPKEANVNVCHNFLQRLVTDGLQLGMPADAEHWISQWMISPENKVMEIKAPVMGNKLVMMGETREENRDSGFFPTPEALCGAAPETPRKIKRASACPQDEKSLEYIGREPMRNELGLLPKDWGVSPQAIDVLPEKEPLMNKDLVNKYIQQKGWGLKASYVRAGGSLTTISTVGKAALNAVGVAGSVVGAAFVILDYVEHEWLGAALGTVSLVAGVAAGIAISGPLGWIVGGAILAFFAIIPTFFQDVKEPADRHDVQRIIQSRMFGDKSHTGNEQCQKGTADSAPNKDCQVLYGAGTIAVALDLNNFDAVAFATHLNDGYAMTIPDMAKAFYVAIDSKKGADTADKVAYITCHNVNVLASPGFAPSGGTDNPSSCANPTFTINRQNIDLPNVGKANKIWDRMSPDNPNGDCIIVARPGDLHFSDIDLTLSGLPSAIVCGAVDSVRIDGTVVPVNNKIGSNEVPPADKPFRPLTRDGYVCISHHPNPDFCLPPGKYEKQSQQGLEIGTIDGLTLPADGKWSFHTHSRTPKKLKFFNGKPVYDETFTLIQYWNMKSDDYDRFTSAISMQNDNEGDESYIEILGPNDGPIPVCCLFRETNFQGNVDCFGEGAGDLPPQWKSKARSVSCHAGAQAILYYEKLGSKDAYLVVGENKDLNSVPLGRDKRTFSEVTDAMWVKECRDG